MVQTFFQDSRDVARRRLRELKIAEKRVAKCAPNGGRQRVCGRLESAQRAQRGRQFADHKIADRVVFAIGYAKIVEVREEDVDERSGDSSLVACRKRREACSRHIFELATIIVVERKKLVSQLDSLRLFECGRLVKQVGA